MNTLTTIRHMYKIYELFPAADASKQLLLEPLSCILKLSLLQYKPQGTKISVSNNSLHFDEPTLFQGVTRRIGGDSRQDLHNICNPIVKCLEWFPLSDPINAFFYQECSKGLSTLKTSYESQSIITHTLDHYISLLEGKKIAEEIEDSAVVAGLKNMWTEKEIIIVKTMIEHILSLEDMVDREMYLLTLEQILTIKENKVNSYIQSISTSYL